MTKPTRVEVIVRQDLLLRRWCWCVVFGGGGGGDGDVWLCGGDVWWWLCVGGGGWCSGE